MTRTPGCVRAHAITVSSIARFWYSDELIEKSDMKPVQTQTVKGVGDWGLGDWGLGDWGLRDRGLGDWGLGDWGLGDLELGDLELATRVASASKRGWPVTTKVAVCRPCARYHA